MSSTETKLNSHYLGTRFRYASRVNSLIVIKFLGNKFEDALRRTSIKLEDTNVTA